MKITSCPKCGVSLELPDGTVDGAHVRCASCKEKFTYVEEVKSVVATTVGRRSNGSVPPWRGPIRIHIARKPTSVSRPKIPKVTLVAVVCLYVLTVMGFMGTAQQNFIAALSTVCLLGGLTLGVQLGRNWTRVALMVIVGGVWMMTCAFSAGTAVLIFLLWIGPLVLLWLPATNAWFREMGEHYRLERLQSAERLKKQNHIIKLMSAILGGAICIYVSGLGMFAMYDFHEQYQYSLSLENLSWSLALISFIPISPLLILLQFVGAIFVDDMPFWLGAFDLWIAGVGWGLWEWAYKDISSFMGSKRN